MNNLKQKANKFLSIACAGYETNTTDGYDFDCGYEAKIECDECVCNFRKYFNSQVFYDPVNNKPISKKVLKYMRKILKEVEQ